MTTDAYVSVCLTFLPHRHHISFQSSFPTCKVVNVAFARQFFHFISRIKFLSFSSEYIWSRRCGVCGFWLSVLLSPHFMTSRNRPRMPCNRGSLIRVNWFRMLKFYDWIQLIIYAFIFGEFSCWFCLVNFFGDFFRMAQTQTIFLVVFLLVGFFL